MINLVMVCDDCHVETISASLHLETAYLKAMARHKGWAFGTATIKVLGEDKKVVLDYCPSCSKIRRET